MNLHIEFSKPYFMKTQIISMLLLFSLVTLISAQTGSTLTATLVSGETSNVFYGQDSFNNAYNASKDGDAIYLSSGIFPNIEIRKSLKIIGAGAFAEFNTVISDLKIRDYANLNLTGIFISILRIGSGLDNGVISIRKCQGSFCILEHYGNPPLR